MQIVQQWIEKSLPVWQECLDSAFVTRLENDTLDETAFKGYIVEDSLYLREYAKVFAWAMTKAQTMQQLGVFYSMLAFVNESEDATRRQYLRRLHLSQQQIELLPLRRENQAYVDAMTAAAKQGGAAECMAAVLPCLLSYGWIIKRVAARTPQVLATRYGPFVRDYMDARYESICRSWCAFANQEAGRIDAKRQNACGEIFLCCSRHELNFWQMALEPRSDI